jgi:hypothetical protein
MSRNLKPLDELAIMTTIYNDLTGNLEQMKASNTLIKEVRHNIEQHDNDYFETKCDNEMFKCYLSMFDDVNLYNELVCDLEALKEYLEEKIKNICCHEWVCDLVDVSPDRSQHIVYCMLCEVTKK